MRITYGIDFACPKILIIIAHFFNCEIKMRTTLLITKEKIISVAQKLFIETSFYRTTMKDIARAAKVSRRTLYTHFNSKEDIFNHIVDQKIELIEQKLEQAVRTALPADKRLKLYIKERFNLIAELMAAANLSRKLFYTITVRLKYYGRI